MHAQLRNAHAAELDAVRQAAESEASTGRAQHESELNQLRLDLTATRSDLEAAHLQLSELKDSLSKAVDETSIAKAALTAAQAQAAAVPTDSPELEQLRSALAEAKTELETTQRAMEETQTSFAQQTEASHRLHQDELERHAAATVDAQEAGRQAKLKHDRELEETKVGHQGVMSDFAKQLEDLEADKKQAEEEVARLRGELETAKASASAATPAAEPSEEGQALEKLKSDHEARIAELHQAHTAKVSELEGRLEALQFGSSATGEQDEDDDFQKAFAEKHPDSSATA